MAIVKVIVSQMVLRQHEVEVECDPGEVAEALVSAINYVDHSGNVTPFQQRLVKSWVTNDEPLAPFRASAESITHTPGDVK